LSKIERNDLCYCGSGKKYKNCCLKQSRESTSTLSDSDILIIANNIQQKCIKEHGDNEAAAKQFWKELVTTVYKRDPAAVPIMIEAQPDIDNQVYMS
jgi:hypothetical protein